MPDVSLVITSYNSPDSLKECLDSIDEGITQHSFEVIVVDDASEGNSIDMIAKMFDKVSFIKNMSNIGYVRSANIGLKSAKGRYLMLLNNDTAVTNGAIDLLIDFADSHPDFGAIGPKLVNRDGTIQLQCRRSFPTPLNSFFYFSGLSRLFPKNKLLGSYLLTYLDDRAPAEVDCLCGAAMMVRREAIDKAGLMDESYHMYGDDVDWCYRIKESGWKMYYLPAAEIIHYGGMGGSRRQSYRNIVEFHRAMAVFHKKHYSIKYLFLFNWLIYAAIWLKCGISLSKNVFRKDKYVGTKKP